LRVCRLGGEAEELAGGAGGRGWAWVGGHCRGGLGGLEGGGGYEGTTWVRWVEKLVGD